MTADDNYCIKAGYSAGTGGNVTYDHDGRTYWTAERRRLSLYYQRHVYQRAVAIGRARGARAVVDLGCGAAAKTRSLLAPAFERVVGIDQPSIIGLVREWYPGAEFVAADFEGSGGDVDGAFDLVVCADVIEHVTDPDALLDRMRRLARPGAAFVLSTPERDLVRGVHNMRSPKPEHIREWNRAEFARYLTTRGFRIVEHSLVPEMAANWSRTYARILTSSLRARRPLRTCQRVVCERADAERS